MPRLHLETSADVVENDALPEILAALVQAMASQSEYDPSVIKAYHSLRGTWIVGDGHPEGFVHLTAMVLAGRTLEARQRLAAALWAVLQTHYHDSLDRGDLKLTLEIREMDRETYVK